MKLPQLSNIGNWFPKLQPRAGKSITEGRPFRVAQIEVTSRCSTGCIFCPHDTLVKSWVEGDLPIELYREKIAPYLDWFDLVYLQGWGEPMLHPHLWEMLSLAHEKGCRTGFTTNGARLLSAESQRLIDLGVSMISVSFAGSAPGLHQSLRTHSDFGLLCQNFENLARLKHAQGAAHPWLELHFLMTRANLDEFPALVELAASLGADEVVATNLTYSPSLALDKMHIFGEIPAPEDIRVIEAARETAGRLKIPLRVYPLQTEPDTLVCDADPINTVYINHRGEVAPCVYLGLTVEGRIPRYHQGESHPLEALSFGNICNGLEQALKGRERIKFIEAFKRRNLSSSPLAMFTYMAGQDQPGVLPSPPVPCQHCYKMSGV